MASRSRWCCRWKISSATPTTRRAATWSPPSTRAWARSPCRASCRACPARRARLRAPRRRWASTTPKSMAGCSGWTTPPWPPCKNAPGSDEEEQTMRILDGLKVLEVASLGPVPWGGMLLADMGASLIRVDRPDGGPAGADRDPVRRGRSAVRLDLKSAQGRAGFLRLAARADVLMEGMRPGVMERLGVGPGPCLQANPRLVYARMTGWGQAGPLAPRAGHDINYIATTGALHAIGTAQAPVVPLNLVADYGGGGAFLVMGILAAVLQARQSGQGRVLDIAMIDGVASLMTAAYVRLTNGSWQDRRAANALDGGASWYVVYETRDGKHVAVGAVEAPFYQELLEKLALTHLPDRADAAHWPAIRAALAQAFA